MENDVEIAKRQIEALEMLKKEYGEEKFNEVSDELNAKIQFVDMGYAVLMIGNTLAIRYGQDKEYAPRQKMSDRYSSKNV